MCVESSRLPSPPPPQFVKGDIVLAKFEGKPADARIVQVDGVEVQIEWVGFEDDPKEWKFIKDITKKDDAPVTKQNYYSVELSVSLPKPNFELHSSSNFLSAVLGWTLFERIAAIGP